MQNGQTLPPGYVPIEEAIALIQADKRDDAKVDLRFLVNNLPYLRVKGNYNIRLLKHVTDEKTGERKVVRNKSVRVHIATEYDKQILMKAIREAYQERTNITLAEDGIGVNKLTSMIDEEKGTSERLRENADSDTQVGTDISKPHEQVLQGV